MSWQHTAPYFYWQALRYARNRIHFKRMTAYFPQWKEALLPGHNSVTDERAWITFDALDYLDRWLLPTHRVFEYGGGGSTLFFCKRASFVATVEHDGQWFDILTQKVKEKNLRNWEGFFIPGEPVTDGSPPRPSDPNAFRSGGKGFENQSFEKYAKAIIRYPPASFDLILVDGRARPACIQQALSQLRPGGLLVVDNAERDYYTAAFEDGFKMQFEPVLTAYSPGPYAAIFTITLVMVKK